jgi:surfactin synthase thioesterase subunit
LKALTAWMQTASPTLTAARVSTPPGASAPAGPWVPQPAIAAARARLFCFHHSGGHPGVFASWQEYLGTDIEVLPVCLPGHGSRSDEPLITRLATLVAAAEEALRPYFDRPFCFFGHGMGALLAYELTLRLAGQRASPLLLCVSGRQAPHLPVPERFSNLERLSDIELMERLGISSADCAAASDEAQVGGSLLPILRADAQVCDDPATCDAPPLARPIIALGGTRDVSVSLAAVSAWAEQTNARFTCHLLPGDHLFYRAHAPRICQTIAITLRACELEPATA